ncbi:MAG: ABC transporter permease [Deltaproteobacteria bacterium]|nr:ABC transporter permease [Deltaproteobacteria bacterium]
MKHFLIRVAALAHKETLHLIRDTQALWLALGMPIVLVVLFGYAVTFDLESMDLVVVDHDKTPESRQLVESFVASTSFRALTSFDDERRIEPLFRAGRAQGALVIPKAYARSLARGEPAEAQLALDGSDGTSTSMALGHAVLVAQSDAVARLSSAFPEGLPLEPRTRTWFNPEMRSALFVVPGLVGTVLAILATLLSALTVAREWERGSMEQLFATPVGRLPIVLGKLLPYVGLGMLQLGLVLAAGVWLFDVPIRGSLPLLLLSASIFLLAALGQGFFISTVTKSQQLATQVGALSAILPSFLLSGFLFPVRNMPKPLQLISNAIPARWVLEILRGVMLRGVGLAELWPQLLSLSFLSLLIVAACTAKFQRNLG